ncbi:Muscle M-line assembly protein unc-89 [Collichthys lucidus]|uniref:Muscle M-line assembly protein unc-89 n=1 Tax=Collichthys lucidus TaxID=240159 RepID=A0A4U5TWH2_COLLU|nr:Muscle M-line assembly protein unc-89 [Collichthys lucidus]
MPGCRLRRMHVAKHLKTHHVISRRRLKEELVKLKRAAGIAALAKLRATNPQPPMATTLDLPHPREGSSTSQRQPCANPSCRALAQHCQGLEKEIKRLGRSNAALRFSPLCPHSSSSSPKSPRRHSSSSPKSLRRPSSSSSSPKSLRRSSSSSSPKSPRRSSSSSPQRPSSSSSRPPPPHLPRRKMRRRSSSPKSPRRPSSSSSRPPPPHLPPEETQQQQQQQQPSSSSSSSEEDEETQQQQPQEPATPKQEAKTLSARRRLPFTSRLPQQSSSSSSSSSDGKPARSVSPGAPAEDTKPKLGKVARRVHRAMAPYFTGKSRGSKIRGIVLGASLDAYVEDYGQFIFCPEGTAKMMENAVSKISRAKVFLKYLTLGWSQLTYWTWEFLFNIPLLKFYPAVLRKVGLAPTTISLYVGQAISFMEYFRDTPPKYSRITTGQTVVVIRELRKLSKDLSRTVLGHQALIKQEKGKRLVAREDLARCQELARAKIPSLLEDIEKAAPRDPKTRYRFFGYFAAYLSSIYGHRTGVLTRMRVKEVRAAIGDDTTGYLINVLEHKTVRKFGTAQIYLNAEEYGWCWTWLRLRSRTVPTNRFFFIFPRPGGGQRHGQYFRRAWTEMGLKGAPSIMDVKTAVSTLNFESNRDSEVRTNLASFMCHSVDTQDHFYALHRNIKRAQTIRKLFVCLAVAEPEQAAAAAAGAAAAATTQPREGAMRMRASTPNLPDPGEDPGSSTCSNRQCRKKIKRLQRLNAALRVEEPCPGSGTFGVVALRS